MIGRELEFAAALDAIERARGGRATSLAICGEAGIGKTTLLDMVRRHGGSDVQVLATQGRAADAEIGYSSMLTLLRPIEQRLDELVGPHADAVRAALMIDRSTVDPIAVQVGVFRAICSLAEHGPVLVAIDDAHHLDAATAAALAFALGRLDADPVAAVMTVDPTGPSVWSEIAAQSLTLGPLDDDTIAGLVREDGEIDDAVLEHCARLAGGNPLAAIEITRALSSAERAGRVPTPIVPRLSSGLAQSFHSRLADAGDAVQRAMVVVAADDTSEIDVVRTALRALDEPDESLAAAESAGLIVIDGGAVRLAHPLLRAVAYHQVAPRSRRAAHWALAGALTAAHQGAAKAWQLVAAADGPDDDAASALDLVALDAGRRGGPASAARISERAALLTGDTSARTRRVASAARSWFAAGEIDRCRSCLDQLATLPVTNEALAAVGAAAVWTDGPRRAQTRVHHLAARADASLVPIARALSADLAVSAGFVQGVVDLATDLLDDADVGPLTADVLSRIDGRRRRSLHRAADRGAAAPFGELSGLRRRRAAAEAGRLDEVAGDIAEISPLAGLVLPSGIDDQLTVIAVRRSSGELNQASAAACVALELLPDSALLPRAAVNIALADIELLLGRRDDARDRLERAVPVVAEYGFTELAAWAGWVSGRLDLDNGDVDAAIDALERAARLRPHLYGAEFVVAAAVHGRGDAVRWLSANDCLDAPDVVGSAGAVAVDNPLAAVRRLRALAVVHNQPELFDRAAEVAMASGLRIEEAETWLVAAEWAAQRGSPDVHQQASERAAERLGALGARFGLRRLEPERASSDVAELLSPAESRVALAVAEGLTNKEVATALFVSVKTVDFHLQGIYRKLGVRSRTELAVRMNRRSQAATWMGASR